MLTKKVNNQTRLKLLHKLEELQKENGFIPNKKLVELAGETNIPVGEIYGVMTFYSFLTTTPLGKNVVRICKSVPCYLNSGQTVLETVQETIGINPGETTTDKRFSLVLVNCIGACDSAPAFLINEKVYGNLTPEKVVQILKSYE